MIRHGETIGAEKRQYKGSIDVPLSENGIRQMERVSEYIFAMEKRRSEGTDGAQDQRISATDLSAVYCSDLNRTIRSADIIALPHSLDPIIVPSLRERNFGVWEGMSFDEIKEKYPEEFDAWAENPLKFSPVGGESTSEMSGRVIKAFDGILANHPREYIAVVAHGGVNRIILCHLLGVPLENIFRIEQDYGALNIVEFWDKYPVVRLVNGVFDV